MAEKVKDKDDIKAKHDKAGLIFEVADDGSVFYYESEEHKTKVKDKKGKK